MVKVSQVTILAENEEPMEGVLETAKRQCGEMIIVRGCCRGIQRNKGIQMAKYPYVVMVDRDCYFTPNYVKKLLKEMNDDVGAVCGLHIPHPSLSFFSKLEEYSKTAVALNIGYTGAHGTLYNSRAVVDAGGFNVDPTILEDKGEKLILNMKRRGYRVKLVKNALTYHMHHSRPRDIVINGLTCGTTRDTSLFRLFGRFFYSPISGITITKKLLNFFNEIVIILLPFFWIFKCAVFAIAGLFRRI